MKKCFVANSISITIFTSVLLCVFFEVSGINEVSNLGQIPKRIVLSGEDGGIVGGGAWDSAILKGETSVLIYVDPDESELNDHVFDELRKNKSEAESVKSYVVLNMAASWIPNFLINMALKEKQKENPDTIYLKDYNRKFVKDWYMKDNTCQIVVINSHGRITFSKYGKLSGQDISKMLSLIEESLDQM